MTIAEMLKKLQDSRTAALGQQTELAEKAAAEDRSLASDEQTQVDELQAEVEQVDADIDRYQKMLESEQRSAAPVDKGAGQPGTQFRTAKNTSDISGGIGFARVAQAKALASIENYPADQIAAHLFDDERIVSATKAAVSPATTTDPAWAGDLVTPGGIYGDFVEFLRAKSIVGRLSLRSVPFNVPLPAEDTPAGAAWVGEDNPIGVTEMGFSSTTLTPLKVASIATASRELLRDSSLAAAALIRDSLADAAQEAIDVAFIDPANAGTAGVKPQAITNGVTGITASGTDAAAVRKDLKAIFEQFISANRNVNGAAWIMDGSTALALSLMQNNLSQPEFPGMNMEGGRLAGIPCIVSEYVPLSSATAPVKHQIFLIDQSNVYFAEDQGVEIDMTDSASLEMNDAPNGTGSIVSLFQHDLIGWRITRRLNWKQRRANSVARVKGATYGS